MNMDNLHMEEFKQRIAALTDDEKEVVVKMLSNEILVGELNRRLTGMTDKMTLIKDILE